MLGRAPFVGEPTEEPSCAMVHDCDSGDAASEARALLGDDPLSAASPPPMPLQVDSRRLLSPRVLWLFSAAAAAVTAALLGSFVGAHIAALRRRQGPDLVTVSRRPQSFVSLQEVSNGQRLAYIVLTQYPNKCVDVTSGTKQSGTAIQIWDCDAHPDMQFLVSPAGQTGYIRWAAHPEMCLDVPGVGPESSEMMLWECTRGKAEHLNFLMPDGDAGNLRVASDDKFCLQVIDNNITNGRWMSAAAECSASPAGSTGFSIVTPVDCPWNEWAACSVKCGGGLRVRTRQVQDGQVYRCKESKSEVEECGTQACEDSADAIVTPYRSAYITVTKHPSKCLDVTGGYHTNGNAIQLWDCGNHPDMQFLLLDPGEGGLIRWSTHSNLCIDAPPDGQLMLWSCDEVQKQDHMLFRLPTGDRNGMSTGNIAMLAYPEKLLEVPDDNASNGRWLQVWDGHTPVRAARDFTIYSPVSCEWQTWTEWSECSAKCGGGTRGRKRSSRIGNKWVWSKDKRVFEAVDCGEDSLELKCNTEKCAGHTTTKTKTSTTTTRTRTRTKATITTRTRTSTTSTSRTKSTTTTTRTVTGTTRTKTMTKTTTKTTTTTTTKTRTTTSETTTSSTRTRTVTTTSTTSTTSTTTTVTQTTVTTTTTTVATTAAAPAEPGAAEDGPGAGGAAPGGESSGKACVVQLATKIEGLDFVALQAVTALTAQVKSTATAKIAEMTGVSEDDVEVDLQQGSVIVAADIQTSAENTASVEGSAEKAASEGGTGAFASGLLTAVRDIPGIGAVQLPGQAISVGSVSKSTKDAARSPNAAIADEASPSSASSAGPSDGGGGGGVAGVLVGIGLGLLSLLAVGAACFYLAPSRRGLCVGSGFDSMRAFSLLYYGDENKGERSNSQDGVSYYHRQADIDIVGTGATSGTLPAGEKDSTRTTTKATPASNSEPVSPPSVVASAGFAPRQAVPHRPQGPTPQRQPQSGETPPTHVPRRAVPRGSSPGPEVNSPAVSGSRTPRTPKTPLQQSRQLVPGTPPVVGTPGVGTFMASSQAPSRQRGDSPGPHSRSSPYHRTPGSTPGLRTPGRRSPGHRTPVGHSGRRTPPSAARSQASSPPSGDGWVSRGSRCRVAVARAAEDGNELTVREGDVLFVSNEAGKWVYGLLAGLPGTLDEDRSGEGWLPKDILETVD